MPVTQEISYPKFEIRQGMGRDGVWERKFELVSDVVEKTYRLYFDKHFVCKKNYCTHPFGYRGPLVDTDPSFS